MLDPALGMRKTESLLSHIRNMKIGEDLIPKKHLGYKWKKNQKRLKMNFQENNKYVTQGTWHNSKEVKEG